MPVIGFLLHCLTACASHAGQVQVTSLYCICANYWSGCWVSGGWKVAKHVACQGVLHNIRKAVSVQPQRIKGPFSNWLRSLDISQVIRNRSWKTSRSHHRRNGMLVWCRSALTLMTPRKYCFEVVIRALLHMFNSLKLWPWPAGQKRTEHYMHRVLKVTVK